MSHSPSSKPISDTNCKRNEQKCKMCKRYLIKCLKGGKVQKGGEGFLWLRLNEWVVSPRNQSPTQIAKRVAENAQIAKKCAEKIRWSTRSNQLTREIAKKDLAKLQNQQKVKQSVWGEERWSILISHLTEINQLGFDVWTGQWPEAN